MKPVAGADLSLAGTVQLIQTTGAEAVHWLVCLKFYYVHY